MHVAVLCVLASLAGGCLFPFPATPISTAPTGDAPTPETLPPSAGSALPTSPPTPIPTPGTPGEPAAELPAPGAPQTPGAPQALTVWLSEQIGPLAEGRALDVLQQQFAAFEATHPGLTVDVLIKKAEGPGGI